MRVGLEPIERYEHELLAYATERLGLTLFGTAAEKAGVLSFILAGHQTEQVGGLLDKQGIAVRSGHHCAQPILRRFGVEATVRASLAPYNTYEDIDVLVAALHRLQEGSLLAAGGIDLIDVREPDEWATGHLPGARLVPLKTLRADLKSSVASRQSALRVRERWPQQESCQRR